MALAPADANQHDVTLAGIRFIHFIKHCAIYHFKAWALLMVVAKITYTLFWTQVLLIRCKRLDKL